MHSAVASRVVASVAATSTIRAAPCSSRCVSRFTTEHQDMRMSVTDGVLFDYGRTLVTFEYPTDDLLGVLSRFRSPIEAELGVNSPEPVTILHGVLLPMEAYVSSTSEDEVDYMDVYRESWRKAGLTLSDPLLYEILDAQQQCWDRAVRFYPDALPILSWLGERGIKPGICFNAPFPPEMMRRQVQSNGIPAGLYGH